MPPRCRASPGRAWMSQPPCPEPNFPTRASNSARPAAVHIEQTFSIDRSPEVVFDYMTDPANLAQWQPVKTHVEQLTDGPPGLGTRIREGTNPPLGREFDMVTEFTEFDRPRRFHVHVVEGP